MAAAFSEYIVGLDVGSKRVGIALANAGVRLPSPYKTVPPDQLKAEINSLLADYSINTIVVGIPRNLDGNDTPQTAAVRTFIESLQLGQQVVFQDEALTSVKAEALLPTLSLAERAAGLDAVAAALILQDYINTMEKQ